MAKKKGKPAHSAAQANRHGEPSWRKTPARSRRQIRERQQRAGRSRDTRLAAEVTPATPQPVVRERTAREERAASAPASVPARNWRAPLLRALRQGFVLALLAATIYGLIQFFQWPALAVTSSTAQIGGSRRLAPRTIYDASGVEGRNIFLIRRAAVEAYVEAVPGVASAEVHLRLPNQIVIDVHEHSPLVAWHSITETVWLAADGAEVPQAGAAPPLTLTDATGASLAQSRGLWPVMLAHLAEIHAAQPDVQEFSYGEPQGLYYRTAAGAEVWLGDTGPMTKKVALAADAQPEIARAGGQAKVIDLRFSEDKALWW